MFSAAWKAINSLNIYDVEEIRSYRTPPELVTLVVNAICLLFNKEQRSVATCYLGKFRFVF